ncbi:lysylphosphatidylglycerol synthase domain-containing protein [Amycolatopsis taiwanensis]|uniref:Membrane protein n=1 Tax=Amycolatopsis taiwanensis TaxID=342230 RepID=A0A9W6QZY1_9PSEU|nr:lysylphosphatidylglycerol synthase domain-containing protein [Amycolatopsis taiwanensis]GLY65117.1 membrane protein [Amycolatopsis taiwanensis]
MGDEPVKPATGEAGSAPPMLPLGRHPRDLAVLVFALAVVAACSLVARWQAANPVELAIFEEIERIPPASTAAWNVFQWAGGWLGVAAVAAIALYFKRIRLGLQCVAAGAVAWVLAGIANDFVGPRYVPPKLLAPETRVPGPTGFAFPDVEVAMVAALVAVIAPYLKPGYRRAAWAVVVVIAVAGVYLGRHLPLDAFAGVFLGWAVGALFHLLFGAPGRRTSVAVVRQTLEQAGLAPVEVVPVRTRRYGPQEVVVTTASGDRLRVEVVRHLRRRAGMWYRLRRLLASLEVEDEPPLSSPYHEAEHEALLTLLAERGGVRIPPVVLACQAPDGSALLVRRQIDGRRLSDLGLDEIDEPLLKAFWDHVAKLGDARIAHHDLRARNVLVDAHGEPWLLGLALGKAGATPGRTAQDIAEALVSIASLVGVERAVLSATRALSPDRLEPALAYLQPLALPRRVRKQLASERFALTDLRETLAERIGRPIPTFHSPLRPSRLVGLLLFGAAVYTLLPQLTNLSGVSEALAGANWTWLAISTVTGLVALLLAAVSIIGASWTPLPFWRTTAVQVAAAFTGRTTPGGVGFFGINIAFMERIDIRRSQAVGVTMLNVAATGVLGGIWSVVGAFGMGTAGVLTGISIPHGWPVVAGALGALAIVVAVLASPFGRRRFVQPGLQVIRELVRTLGQPRRAIQLFGGAAGYLAVSGLGLVTSLAAFDPHMPVFAVLTVFVIGQTFGHIIPTPGGLGAVESLMIGGLAALDIAPTTAVAAVLTSRLLTYWLPVLPGIAVFRYLQHREII